MEKNNLPIVRDPKQAFELIQKHKASQDLIFVTEEDLRTHTMFIPEVVVIHAAPDDFHNISGNYMPKGYQTDRIGEASGISFIDSACSTRKESEYVWIGRSQGQKRSPDGTWRKSHVHEYEFDAEKRSQEDFLNHPDRYSTEILKKKRLLELARFGRQKAGTGAHLKVIRELTGMPISFKQQEVHKAMVFSRVAVNTDLLLADPEMREAAIKVALGASQQIYGPEKKAIEQKSTYEVVENGNPETGTTEEKSKVPWNAETAEDQESKDMIGELKAGRDKLDDVLPENAKSIIDDVLSQEKPDPKTISSLIDKLNDWESRYVASKKEAPNEKSN